MTATPTGSFAFHGAINGTVCETDAEETIWTASSDMPAPILPHIESCGSHVVVTGAIESNSIVPSHVEPQTITLTPQIAGTTLDPLTLVIHASVVDAAVRDPNKTYPAGDANQFVWKGKVNGTLCPGDTVEWEIDFQPDNGFENCPPAVTAAGRYVVVSAPFIVGGTDTVSPGVLTLTPTVRKADNSTVPLLPLVLNILAANEPPVALQCDCTTINSTPYRYETVAASEDGQKIVCGMTDTTSADGYTDVLISVDGGVSWSPKAFTGYAPGKSLSAVSRDGNRLYAVRGTGLTTVDAFYRYNGTGALLGSSPFGRSYTKGLCCNGSGRVVFLGKASVKISSGVRRSVDYGVTFSDAGSAIATTVSIRDNSLACSAHEDKNEIVVFVSLATGSKSLYSVNGGTTWNDVSGYCGDMTGAGVSGDGETIVFVPHDGDTLIIGKRQADDTFAWSDISHSTITGDVIGALNGVGISHDGQVIAVGRYSEIWVSLNRGATWKLCCDFDLDSSAQSIWVAPNGKMLLAGVGHASSVLKKCL